MSRAILTITLAVFFGSAIYALLNEQYAVVIGLMLVPASLFLKLWIASKMPDDWPEWATLAIGSLPVWIVLLAIILW